MQRKLTRFVNSQWDLTLGIENGTAAEPTFAVTIHSVRLPLSSLTAHVLDKLATYLRNEIYSAIYAEVMVSCPLLSKAEEGIRVEMVNTLTSQVRIGLGLALALYLGLGSGLGLTLDSG